MHKPSHTHTTNTLRLSSSVRVIGHQQFVVRASCPLLLTTLSSSRSPLFRENSKVPVCKTSPRSRHHLLKLRLSCPSGLWLIRVWYERFNGAPCGRSEPPGKAEMVEGRREGVMEGHSEGHSLASGEIQPRVSSSRWLKVRERSELLQLDFQGYPLFKQVLEN